MCWTFELSWIDFLLRRMEFDLTWFILCMHCIWVKCRRAYYFQKIPVYVNQSPWNPCKMKNVLSFTLSMWDEWQRWLNKIKIHIAFWSLSSISPFRRLQTMRAMNKMWIYYFFFMHMCAFINVIMHAHESVCGCA